MPGQITPSRIADSTSSARPTEGSSPGAPPDVGEEQHRADHRDAEQDVLGRQHRVVVGVGDAGDEVPDWRDQVEAVEPVVGRLGQHEQAEQHRELRPARRRRAGRASLQPDPAVEVVHVGRGEQREHQRSPS